MTEKIDNVAIASPPTDPSLQTAPHLESIAIRAFCTSTADDAALRQFWRINKISCAGVVSMPRKRLRVV